MGRAYGKAGIPNPEPEPELKLRPNWEAPKPVPDTVLTRLGVSILVTTFPIPVWE